MNFSELLAILKKVNRERETPVDDGLLEQVVALVMRNPLDEDRSGCQEQIGTILNQYVGDGQHAD